MLKTKYSILLASLFIGLVICSSSLSKKKYFTGDLYYSMTMFNSEKETITDSISLSKIGVRVHNVEAGDKRYRKTYNQIGELLSIRVLDLKQGTYKLWVLDRDTVFVFNTNEQELGTKIVSASDSVFRGEKVKKVVISGYNTSSFQVNDISTYLFAENLRVDADLYEEYKEGGYGEIVKKYPYLYVYLKREYLTPFYGVNILELDSLNERVVDDTEFDDLIPDHLPLKKI